ncbi:GTA-gp10 family protein [Brevundimonas sp.]|uniref:GTA-gp10 family protein n=1 Tax=Brevundimonas sp. TaxID=1871086 RepID=UPI0035B39C56
MANPMKGEVSFEAGGDRYVLAYTINALVTLESKLGVTTTQLGELLGANLSMGNLRTLFWAGLLANHDCTEEEAGNLISDIGITRAGELIGEGLTKAFPEAGKSTARPRPAAAGTGKTS